MLWSIVRTIKRVINMPVIIDQNSRRKVTQQEYDAYISSISPTFEQLKQHKLTQLAILTQQYISSKIFYEIERSVRTTNPVPAWVNEFTNSVIQKNYSLRTQINETTNINELNLVDINLVME